MYQRIPSFSNEWVDIIEEEVNEKGSYFVQLFDPINIRKFEKALKNRGIVKQSLQSSDKGFVYITYVKQNPCCEEDVDGEIAININSIHNAELILKDNEYAVRLYLTLYGRNSTVTVDFDTKEETEEFFKSLSKRSWVYLSKPY